MSASTWSRNDARQAGGRATFERGIVPAAAIACLALTGFAVNHAASLAKPLLALLVLLITVIQVAALKHRCRVAVPAAALVVTGLNLIGLGGDLFYRSIAQGAAVSAILPSDDAIYRSSGIIFAVASLSVWAGAMLVGGPAPQTRVDVRAVMRSMSPRITLLVGGTPLLLLVIGFTPNALIERGHHLEAHGPVMALSAGSMSMPVALAVLAFAIFDTRRPFTTRASATLLAVAAVVTLFAVGTRQISLLPGLLLIGWLMNPPREGAPHRFVRTWAVVAVLATIPLLQLPLTLRGGPSGAGWAPFTAFISANPGVLFQIRPSMIFGNVLFSFPLSGTVLREAGGNLTAHDFVTSVNPLPGQFTDWVNVFPRLGLNNSTPFNGLGELAAHGWTYLIVYMAVIGFVLAVIQRAAQRFAPTAATIMSLASLGVAAVFTYAIVQYNLRTGIRGIWYLIGLTLLVKALSERQQGHSTGEPPEADGAQMPSMARMSSSPGASGSAK